MTYLCVYVCLLYTYHAMPRPAAMTFPVLPRIDSYGMDSPKGQFGNELFLTFRQPHK